MKSSESLFLRGSRIFLITYVILGFFSLLTPRQEIFPVFSWFLFPFTPQLDQMEFNLRLIELNGIPQEHHPFYKEASPDFTLKPHSPEAWLIIQNLGNAYMKRDLGKVEELRKLLEHNYIPNVTAYSLVEIGFNPIKAFQRAPDALGENPLIRFQRDIYSEGTDHE